jgi:HK97 family phage prohead protease
MEQLKLLTHAVRLTKTPTDGSGSFEAIVANWGIDRDNERFDRAAFDDLDGATPIPLRYQHVKDDADPGSKIGVVFAKATDAGLKVAGQLDLNNPMALAVYERMLLPASDKNALREFSVGFQYEPAKTYKGPQGERVIPKAKLVEVSVVYQGSQKTELLSIKDGSTPAAGAYTSCANHVAQSAVEALRGGLFEDQQVLQQASRDLRLLAGGVVTRGADDILKAIRPIVAKLRAAGRTIGADNLATTISEIESAYEGKARTTMTGTQARAMIESATAVEGNALVQFAEMKKALIRSFPAMARDVFGELTATERKALAARKARDKAAFDGPVAESPEPVFDARFAVQRQPEAIPVDPPEVITLPIAEYPDDSPIRAQIVEDGSR